MVSHVLTTASNLRSQVCRFKIYTRVHMTGVLSTKTVLNVVHGRNTTSTSTIIQTYFLTQFPSFKKIYGAVRRCYKHEQFLTLCSRRVAERQKWFLLLCADYNGLLERHCCLLKRWFNARLDIYCARLRVVNFWSCLNLIECH